MLSLIDKAGKHQKNKSPYPSLFTDELWVQVPRTRFESLLLNFRRRYTLHHIMLHISALQQTEHIKLIDDGDDFGVEQADLKTIVIELPVMVSTQSADVYSTSHRPKYHEICF
jgi:hypothetical protein